MRAIGVDRGVRTVVDATAGLGRDAFALAAVGASVTLIERDPVLAALLDDAIARAPETDADTAAIVARLTLLPGAAEWIPQDTAAAGVCRRHPRLPRRQKIPAARTGSCSP